MRREDEGNRAAAFHDRRTGGKETGQSVTYYVLPGGPKAKACAKRKAKSLTFTGSRHQQATVEGKERPAAATRTGFVVFRKQPKMRIPSNSCAEPLFVVPAESGRARVGRSNRQE